MTAQDGRGDIVLADGHRMPSLGVGLYKVPPADVVRLVDAALERGYRLFDTATMYENERALGDALRGVRRDDVFVTTKVLNADHGYEQTRAACRRSLERLGLDVVDLLLIHWPAPRQNRYVETWEALIDLQREGLVRSIGVSNFHTHHLDRIASASGVVPVVNQVECHPWLAQRPLIDHHRARGIATQAWSPLARGAIMDDPVIRRIAAERGTTPALVALRWQLNRGVAIIPKTMHVARLSENVRIGEVSLTAADTAALDALDRGYRTGADPDDRD